MKTIGKILFFLTFFLSTAFAGVCPKPIAGTITGSGVMSNQNINLEDLVIDGNDNGEGLYYKIQLPSSGKLVLETSSSGSDTVNTYGQLLEGDCTTLKSNDNGSGDPRYFDFDWDLSTNVYYLRVYNKFSIHDVGGDNKTGYFKLTHTFTPLVATKEISITKTSNPWSNMNSGDSITYTFRIENTGSSPTTSVKVIDPVPTHLDYVGKVVSTDWDCTAGDPVVCTRYDGVMNSGDVEWLNLEYKSNTLSASDRTASGTTTLEAGYSDSSTENDTATRDITIYGVTPNIQIQKLVPSQVLKDSEFDYKFLVENISTTSDINETNVVVTGSIPNGFDIVSFSDAGWSCSEVSKNFTCSLNSDLIKGDSKYFVIRAKAVGATGVKDTEVIDVTANTAPDFGLVSDDDNTVVTIIDESSISSDFDISKDSSKDAILEGDIFTYTIGLVNRSIVDEHNVTVTDTIDSNLTIVSFIGSDWNCSKSGQTITCKKSLLGANTTANDINITVKAPSIITENNTIKNIAKVVSTKNTTGKDVQKDVYLKTSSDALTILIESDTDVYTNEYYDYTVIIQNKSGGEISGIKASTILPLSLAFDNCPVVWGCIYDSSTREISWTKDGFNDGDTKFLNFSVKAPSSEQNITLDIDMISDLDANTRESNVTTEIKLKEIVNIDLSLTIDDSSDIVEGGANYYYDIVIKNHDSVKKAQDIILEINTTSANDYLFVGNSSGWNCSKSSKQLICYMDDNFLPNTTQTLRLEVTAPNIITTVDVNAILYSDFVNDTNPSNNSVTENTDIKITDLSADNPREFTKVKLQGMEDLNILGDVITIGNQSICQQSMGVCVEPWHPVNDLVMQEYINLDPTYGASYKNATKAKLELQVGDKVVWAGLYWMGRVDKGQAGWQTLRDNANKVYLRADLNTSGYIEVQADRASQSIDSNGSEVTVDKFNFINGSDYFDYQGIADVTDYVKANGASYYWVGDIKSSEGDNLSAGWNLVIIVRDTKPSATRDLKNITIFDGFQGVWKSTYNANALTYPDEVNQSVSGILTPSSGPVKSKLIFFGFEGDESLKDFIKVDGIALSDIKGTADDVANGTISKNGSFVTTRSPALQNTSGIDVDEFDVGDSGKGIIGNAQTSVDISIGSDEDRFFLGMFGFSTSLKDPVCYIQKLQNDDFTSVLTEAHLGDKIGIEVMFKNIETQTLYDTHAFLQIDDMFEEDNSSFKLKNVSEGSFTAQNSLFDIGTIQTSDGNLTEVKTSIGTGASALSGGDFAKNNQVYIRYNATINEPSDDNLTHNVYSISYSPSADKKIQVSSCDGKEQNLTILLNEPKGFQVVHEGIDVTTDKFIDINASSSNEAHLFTQVQNNNFGVDIVHIKPNSENGEIEGYTGRIMVELVDMSDYNASIVGSCESLAFISSPIYEIFDSSKPKYKNKTLSYDNAVKSAGYRATYLVDKYNRELWNDSNYASVVGANLLAKLDSILKDDPHGDKRCENSCTVDWTTCSQCIYKSVMSGGLGKSSCSVDKFSVKPESISISSSGGDAMIGAGDYNLSFASGATGYEQNVTIGNNGSLDYNLTNPGGCDGNLTGTLHKNEVLNFTNGNASLNNFTYKNIGDLSIDFFDSNWTAVDQDSNTSLIDCVVGSSSNIPNIDKKVGCNVSGSKLFSFEPERYDGRITSLMNFSGGFTYLSNDAGMSAPLTFEVIAVMADGNEATNFESACYATDVNYTLSMSGVSGTPLFDGGIDGEFDISEGDFTNGQASQTVGLNVQRFANRPINPFVINSGDIDISVEDNGTYGKSGSGFSVHSDENATFYFARVHVPDIQTPQENITVRFNYEVYCDNYDPTIFTLPKGSESPDSVHWYNNAGHLLPNQGGYFNLDSKNETTLSAATLFDANASLGGLTPPHRDRIDFEANSWLLFNKQKSNPADDSFNIHFTSRSNSWAGKGKMGKSVDNNLSKRSTKKMEW